MNPLESNPILYYHYKYSPLGIPVLWSAMVLTILFRDNEDQNMNSLIGLTVIILSAFLGKFFYLKRKLTRVRIDNDGIHINEENVITWGSVAKIDYSIFGLYRIEFREKVFFLVPPTIPRNFLWINFSNDRFTRMIEEKKKEYRI